MFSLVLMSTSCEKDEPVVPEQTLEEMFPDWSNLTWVSTDGITADVDPLIYPRLVINISGDNGTFRQLRSEDGRYYNLTFHVLNIVDNTVTFKENFADFHSITGTFTNDGEFIILTSHCFGDKANPDDEHKYKLKIN